MVKHVSNEKNVMAQIDELDKMDGTVYDPDDTSDDNDDEGTGDDAGTEETTDDDNEENIEALGGTDGSGTTNDEPVNKGKDTKAKEAAPDASTFRKQGTNFVDANNNIVDPQSGQIIAKAGTERRLFEKTQRLGSALDEKSAKLTKYEQDDAKLDNLRGVIKNHGMSTDEFAEGINMVLAFKSDPVGTAKKLLEQVLAMGHNVTDILGADAGNAIEMSAVSRMLDERLKPLIAPLNEKRVQSENEKVAEAAWNKFCEDNPHAEVHDTVMDKLLGDNPGMRPQQAYNHLRDFAHKHNLDFSIPLGPQIEQLQSAPKKKEPGNLPRAPQKPFPNGSSVRHAAIDDGDVNPNSDWNTILRSVPGLSN
jgi:hypothetical protein